MLPIEAHYRFSPLVSILFNEERPSSGKRVGECFPSLHIVFRLFFGVVSKSETPLECVSNPSRIDFSPVSRAWSSARPDDAPEIGPPTQWGGDPLKGRIRTPGPPRKGARIFFRRGAFFFGFTPPDFITGPQGAEISKRIPSHLLRLIGPAGRILRALLISKTASGRPGSGAIARRR